MKNRLATLLVLLVVFGITHAQVAVYNHEFNNVKSIVTNGGVLFQDIMSSSPGYEIPKGSGNDALYNMSFWYAGEDINGQLKISGTKYMPETDMFPGALSDDGAATASPLAGPNLIYPIRKSEIDNHIENWDALGYVVPENIANWPAHGDLDYNQDFYLAPFVDTDGDGIYDPEAGDYPVMRGDFATYMIMNDKRNIHTETGGDPIGIEVHQMIYTYATDDYLNNTTFIHSRIINRSTQVLYTFKAGVFIDPDLGFPTDDLAGVNVDNNVAYVYNGSNIDAGYGENPPAVGVVSLNNDISTFIVYNDENPAQSLPSMASNYYSNLKGIWNDGTSISLGGTGYGGETPTSYMYPGDPSDPEEWSEISNSNLSGDRTMMMAHSFDGLGFKEELCFDYAIIYNRDGDHLENVQGIIDLAGEVKEFYDESGYVCELGVLSVADNEEIDFKVFPNPSSGTFTINAEGDYDIEIMNMTGQIVYQTNGLNNTSLIQTNLAEGVYLLKVVQNGISSLQRLVITAK